MTFLIDWLIDWYFYFEHVNTILKRYEKKKNGNKIRWTTKYNSILSSKKVYLHVEVKVKLM